MSGTWAVVWPSGKPYRFYWSHVEATHAAAHATRLQCQRMKVVLWV